MVPHTSLLLASKAQVRGITAQLAASKRALRARTPPIR
jgi:hypothetical protein